MYKVVFILALFACSIADADENNEINQEKSPPDQVNPFQNNETSIRFNPFSGASTNKKGLNISQPDRQETAPKKDYPKIGLALSNDATVQLLFHVSPNIRLSGGIKQGQSDYTHSTGLTYTRDTFEKVFGLRLYPGNNETYRGFIDLINTRLSVDYSGATTQTNYTGTENGIFGGVEYMLNQKLSIDGRIGIINYQTKNQTEESKGMIFPTADLSLNILF